MMTKTVLVVALVGLLIEGRIYNRPSQQVPKKKVHVEGYIFDSTGNPLGGVDVTVWVTGRPDSVAGTKSQGGTGKYSLDAEVSDVFDVGYTMTNYRSSVVKYLAEKKDQHISKVMYQDGEKMPPSAAHAYVQSLDRIAFFAMTLERKQRAKFLLEFPEGRGEFKSAELGIGTFVDTDQALQRMLINDGTRAVQKLRTLQSGRDP
jgi:hypothetical protein